MSEIPIWKDVEETKLLKFDFTEELATGDTVSSVAVSVEVKTGTDANPDTVLSGAAQTSGAQVLQRVTGGLDQVTYHVRARATDSAGLVHVRAIDLQVVRL